MWVSMKGFFGCKTSIPQAARPVLLSSSVALAILHREGFQGLEFLAKGFGGLWLKGRRVRVGFGLRRSRVPDHGQGYKSYTKLRVYST